ncbi:hypothetical protein KNP414_05148 [Paenibacillus mucilaginosus KNP414]|uniref:Uncharacterized protein n=1 Tax=Paenibacillus mucilaginosus (strain KNP414) TaxID=1036673 RepID=F8F9I3_PAEMK|nr:hypothetical protein KNP414_05148 [Paenibacillus mucilaginosus KNP414]
MTRRTTLAPALRYTGYIENHSQGGSRMRPKRMIVRRISVKNLAAADMRQKEEPGV